MSCNAFFMRVSADASNILEQARFSRIKPLPPGPNMKPSLKASFASSKKNVCGLDGRFSWLQSNHIKYVASGQVVRTFGMYLFRNCIT